MADNVIYGKNGLPYEPEIQEAIKIAKRDGKRIPAAVKRAMDSHDAPEGMGSTVKPKAVAPYNPPAPEVPEAKPQMMGDPKKNTKPKGAANPTPRSERAYPPSGPRGSGNAKRTQSDSSLRVDSGDLTDLGVADAQRGGKVKTVGFVTPLRKTAPKGPSAADAPTEAFRVRQSGPSVSISLPEHHQDISNVVRYLRDATRGLSGDQTHQTMVRSMLDHAETRLQSSAKFHNEGDHQSAVAELTATVSGIATATGSLARHPAISSNPGFNPEIGMGAKNTLQNYRNSLGA
jgi:hypothetical protein